MEGTSPSALEDIVFDHRNLVEAVESDAKIKLRETYEKRLHTYSPSSYFAKPECLSPIICARFGFENVGKNIIQCSACRATLDIDILSTLSQKSKHTLICQFEGELEKAHKEVCRFRYDASLYFAGNKEVSSFLVPAVLSSVFRDDVMELLDPPDPVKPVRTLCGRLKQTLAEANGSSHRNKDVEMEIPNEIAAFGAGGNKETVLTKATRRVQDLDAKSEVAKSDDVLVTLAVLGWFPKPNMACFECHVCWAIFQPHKEIPRQEPPNKKIRRVDCLQAHRYYCPFANGFPRRGAKCGTPLWQSLLERLGNDRALEIDPTESPFTSRMEIHKLLQIK